MMDGAEKSLPTGLQTKKMVPVASICVGWSGLCFHILGQSNADDVELTFNTIW